jgi:probable rRNA maturation factor
MPGDFDKLEETCEDCFHPETGELILGDIVISVERAIKQAEEYGHSVIREFAFLTAHSMLHLMGYDHMEEDERGIMEAKQDEIMEILQISR